MIGREDEVRGYRERVKLFQGIVTIMFLFIASRLVYLQIIKGDDLRKYSEENRLKKDKLFPTRGIIYDRNGKVIVDNRASFDVVMLAQFYPKNDPTMNARLAKALDMPVEELGRRVDKGRKGASFYPVLLKSNVSKDILAAIETDAHAFPGVDIEVNVQRRYPYSEIAAQVLGYTGEVTTRDIAADTKKVLESGDYIGKMGIERTYDSYLRGINGVGYVEVDAMGRRKKSEGAEKLLGFVAQTEPVAGNNVYLTLDADLEVAAASAMKARNYMGSVVALDPRSGEILALVNTPSYDPGTISGREVNSKVWTELRNNKDRPLRNRAIQDHYPPGSTFKLFVAIAGLAEGLVSTKSTVNCSGHLPFGNRVFHCWKRHGVADFIRSIKESCDVFYYQLGHQLGVDTIAKYARWFGLGSQTGIRLAGEQRGNIPDTEWKLKTYKDIWHPGETLSVAIGQGYVDVTPIQLVTGYAAIGNGGFVYRPYLVRRIEGRTGEVIKEYQPELIRKIEIPNEVFDAVKEGLFKVINEPGGTAFLSKSKLTQISGKTGTAQVRNFSKMMEVKCEKLPYYDRHHGWFVGYAPKENPQIAVVVIAEHSCHGSSAGPVVREVIDAYMMKQAALSGTPIVTEVTAKRVVEKRQPTVTGGAAPEPAPPATRINEEIPPGTDE